jgi:hypothetical protein
MCKVKFRMRALPEERPTKAIAKCELLPDIKNGRD